MAKENVGVCVRIVAVCAGFVLIMCAFLIYVDVDKTGYDYGIMMDAGSSGTRMFIYTWPKRNEWSVPLVKDAIGNEVFENDTYALADFASCPACSEEYIRSMVDIAVQRIPQQKQRSTYIYLKATAGMRLLDEQDQDAILDVVRQTFHTYPFKITDPLEQAKVISGADEAVYGWVTVNFLLDTLGGDNNNHNNNNDDNNDQTITYGAMDMGGASTQFTFVTTADTFPPSQYGGYPFTLSNVDYDIYAWSYLSYGRDEANQAMWNIITAGKNNGSTVIDACLASGYNASYVRDDGFVFKLQGTSDYFTCRNQAYTILNISAPCSFPPCSFNGVHQPPLFPNARHFAFSAFAYTQGFLDLPTNPSLNDWAAVSEIYCGHDYQELEALYPDENMNYVLQYCFNAAYIYSLQTAYGFTVDSQLITYGTSINGIFVNWALGAQIYEADLLPWGPKEELLATQDAGIAMSVFGFLFLFGGLAAMIYYGILIHRTPSEYTSRSLLNGDSA